MKKFYKVLANISFVVALLGGIFPEFETFEKRVILFLIGIVFYLWYFEEILTTNK